MTEQIEVTHIDQFEAAQFLGFSAPEDVPYWGTSKQVSCWQVLARSFARHRIASTASLQAENNQLKARIEKSEIDGGILPTQANRREVMTEVTQADRPLYFCTRCESIVRETDDYGEFAAGKCHCDSSPSPWVPVNTHWVGLAKKFRPGGTALPKSITGTRRLLPHSKAVSVEVVQSLMIWLEAAYERIASIATLSAEITSLREELAVAVDQWDGASHCFQEVKAENERLKAQAEPEDPCLPLWRELMAKKAERLGLTTAAKCYRKKVNDAAFPVWLAAHDEDMDGRL